MKAALLLALLASAPAGAAELRDFCPDRPGLGTPPCTMDRGHADIEIGLADWTREGPGAHSLVLGDTLLRYGLTDRVEVQLGWTAFETVREPGNPRISGVGDMRVALRASLSNPDGSGFSAAIMPYASLPTGRNGIGAGTWSAGALLPLSWELPRGLQLDFTGKAEAATDEDGRGRHLDFGGVAGLDVEMSPRLTATAELSVERDEDPGGHATPVIAGLSLAYLPSPSLQLDVGANKGVSGGAPEVELYVGIARRF